jgi:dihydroflavonol-4-reductase
MGASAFVTGAAGFLGRHLVEELHRQGWRVTALCLPTDETGPLSQLARVVPGDITDIASVRTAMPPRPDAVFHLAANTSTWSRYAARQHRDNVTGTANVAQVALERAAGRFVYTSSISAYGYQPGRVIDEGTPSNALTRGDSYGRTKLLAEQQVRRLAECGLPAIVLNPVNVLGPYDRSNWSRQLILPIARGALHAVPPGSATWAYVEDIAAAQLAAVHKGQSGENYVLGGVRASFKQVVNEIEGILGRPPSRRGTPKAALRLGLYAALLKSTWDGRQPAFTPAQYRRAVGDLRCDDAKARRTLGYRHTDLHTMLRRTIDWLRQERLLDGAATEAARP